MVLKTIASNSKQLHIIQKNNYALFQENIMSGHVSWEETKKKLDLKPFKSKNLDEIKPGKYWKSWAKKDKKEDPERWKAHKAQRVKYGYSEVDWWNFDSYIAGVIAHACEKFVKDGHGYPWGRTMEEWHKLCTDIARPLALWASPDRWEISYDDQVELYKQVQEALHKFADNFGTFWD